MRLFEELDVMSGDASDVRPLEEALKYLDVSVYECV
jgi:hypothetical protein